MPHSLRSSFSKDTILLKARASLPGVIGTLVHVYWYEMKMMEAREKGGCCQLGESDVSLGGSQREEEAKGQKAPEDIEG
jgi:hypothetical protein